MDGNFDATTGEIAFAPAMPPAIAAAIIAVGKRVKQLGEDDRNPQGGYKFVSVDKFYATVGKMMAEAGLALLIDETSTEVRGETRTDREGQARVSPWLFAQYSLMFMHESGATSAPLRRSVALPISGPQAFGSAQSYIEKQFLRQVFKVPTGEKDADDTAPTEDAPESRNTGRTAQGSPGRATTAHRSPQAAPARTPGQEKAVAEYKFIAAAISDCEDMAALDRTEAALDSNLALMAAMPEETAVLISQLRDKIEGQRKFLLGGA